jgi:hypothetical protein
MTNRTDTQGGAMTLERGLAAFLDAMLGKNRSVATLRAYTTDVVQFIRFLHAILRTFFERKALAKEATNWLNGLSNPTPT